MKNLKRALASLLCLMMLLSMVACGGNNNAGNDAGNDAGNAGQQQQQEQQNTVIGEKVEEGAKVKDTVVIGTVAAVVITDPQKMRTATDYTVMRATHDTLFRMDEETGDLIPELCEEWSIDGATWTMKLKEGVKFHNGNDFTAEDVKFTFERGKSDDSQIKSYCNKIVDVTIIDDYNCTVSWNSVNVDMGGLFSNPKYSMLDKDSCEADPELGYRMGTGAYTVKELVENSHCIIEAVDTWWGDPVPTKTIEFRYIAEASARLIALQNGELDVCISPNTSELDYIREDKNLELIEAKGCRTIYYLMNMHKDTWKDVEVRRAIAQAINREDLIAICIDGLGVPAVSVAGPNNAGCCDDQLVGVQYDQAAAKATIEAKGLAGSELTIICLESGITRSAAEVIQAHLAAVGINGIIRALPSAEAAAAARNEEHDMYISDMSLSDYMDSLRSLVYNSANYNFAFMDDPKIDEMIDEGVTMTDPVARKAHYLKINQYYWEENVYGQGLFRSNTNFAVVKGFKGMPYRGDLVLDPTFCAVVVE